MAENSNDHWKNLLPEHRIGANLGIGSAHVAGKSILLTGAGGGIGAALARRILTEKPRSLVLLDRCEQSLYQLGRCLTRMEGAPPFRLVPGDVGDFFLVDTLLEEHRPDLILHAAAYKHVPLMEANPFAAVQNNAILTWQLAKAAADAGMPQLLLISTDKAANPHSILGASKKVAEQAVLRWSGPSRRYAGIRLVNVLGSEGSALPLFLEQIDHDGPLTITHPDAARYFMTIEDTVGLIMAVAALPNGGVVYVPKVSAPVRIVEIAERLVRHKLGGNRTIPIEFTGLRPGEKLSEDLLSMDESSRTTPHPSIHEVVSPPVSLDAFDHAFAQLSEAVKRRHLAALLEALSQLVPTYQPSGAHCLDQVGSHG